MRKLLLVVCLAFSVSIGAPSKLQITTLPVFVYGKDDAVIEVVEFCSMYCSACDHFKDTTFPEVEQHYIASGQLRWIRIPFAIDFGDILMLAYMKHLPIDQYQHAEKWYTSFRANSSFTSEDEFHKQLSVGLKNKFSIFKDIQPVKHEEIDGIVQETVRLAEHYKLKHYPTFLIDGQRVSASVIKDLLDKKLKELRK